MNLSFGRRVRTNPEMGSSSLTASLLLLSVVFMQFVSAAGQNDVTIKAEPGIDLILPCKDPDQEEITVIEWSRTDLGPESVLLYRHFQFDPANQDPSYTDRVDLLVGQIRKGDVSLILKDPTTDDSGTYECRVVPADLQKKRISTVSLVVAPPDPFPVWAKVLLVLLVLVLVAAAGVFYLWQRWKPDHTVSEESGVESVLLSLKVPRFLWFCIFRLRQVDKVEWKDRDNRTVHVNQNGSDHPEEQDEFYRTRTRMDKNLLKTGDLSLTLRRPTEGDRGTYSCRVSNRKGHVLMEKQVQLWVKAQDQVEVEPGVESVLLPWRITEDLDGDVRVEWRDKDNRKVHVYQNGSDQPGEQDEFYRTRTKMDENLLKNGDLSLTLRRPTDGDGGTYTCRVYNRKGDVLMEKRVQLQVKAQEQVESGAKSVLLPCRTTESLPGDVRVEWMDGDNRKVHVYQNGSDQPGEQNQFYRTRTKMDENLLETKDLSLTLSWPTCEDENIYTCRVYSRDGDVLMEKRVQLQVKAQEMWVESGVESVLLPCRTTESLNGDIRVEWRDGDNRKVHVYQNGSDQPGLQYPSYRTRTKMDENLLKTGDLSLTLRRPTDGDGGRFICRVSNKDGDVLMKKDIQLQVKVQQVVVEPGVESVLLPCRTTEDLDGDVRVVWMDNSNMKVHVYQNGSDQPGDQDKFYRTRTKMDGNLLKNGDLSLTLRRPTDWDSNIYTCSVYSRDGDVLMEKRVQLQVKVPDQVVKVDPGVESVLLPCRTTEDLPGDVRVEWRDSRYRKVHVYQNGSDRPGEQHQDYKDRTKMDENLLENKDLSLTLRRPRETDTNIYTCSVYNRDGGFLMEKDIQLWVKAGTVQVQPEDIMEPLLADQLV